MKPTFTHDCDSCTFLGTVVMDGKTFDLYHCIGFEPTVIARFSSEGPDYMSGIWFGMKGLARALNGMEPTSNPLMVAYTLAMANGLDVKTMDSDNVLDLAKTLREQAFRTRDFAGENIK